MAALSRPSGPSTVRGLLLVVLAVVLLAAPFQFAPFRVFQFSVLFAYAIALIGLNLLTGYSGQISLGHAAFFAIGAYTTALTTRNIEHDYAYLLALPLAAGICFVAGFLFGVPALRLHGLYLALGTLALSVATPPLLRRFKDVTGGSAGLTVPRPTAPEFTGLAQDQWIYLLSLAVLVAVFVFTRNLLSGRIGRALVAVRDNEVAAQSMGVQLSHAKTSVFAYSSMYAGIGGVLYTWSIGFVAPEAFGLLLSINLLAGLVVGGLATAIGPFLGAAFLYYVPTYAARINDAVPGMVFGALLIAVVLVAPHGLAGVLERGWRAAKRWLPVPRGPAPNPAAPFLDPIEREPEVSKP